MYFRGFGNDGSWDRDVHGKRNKLKNFRNRPFTLSLHVGQIEVSSAWCRLRRSRLPLYCEVEVGLVRRIRLPQHHLLPESVVTFLSDGPVSTWEHNMSMCGDLDFLGLRKNF